MNEKNLIGLRTEIDRIDREMIDLLEKRASAAARIGELKKCSGEPPLDMSREFGVIESRVSVNGGLLSPTAMRSIFVEIVSACRALQGCTRIAYLGPEGTFTHMACLERFGHSSHFVPADSVEEVFDLVERGQAHFGVVPIENSNEGAVGATLDRLATTSVRICGEIYRNVSHALLSREEGMDGVETVFSHPQAIAQCRRWIASNLPMVTAVHAPSTSKAAELAAREPRTAALGNEALAEHYRLNILARDIQDRHPNVTRFFVIGDESCDRTGRDKTSLVFAVAHRPAALYHSLKAFAEHGINMTKIESRPSKESPWDYIFFVDLEGHLDDEPVCRALEDLTERTIKTKILGSYPVGTALDGVMATACRG